MPGLTLRGAGVLLIAIGAYLGGRLVGTYELYLAAVALGLLLAVSVALVLLSGGRLTFHRSFQPERPMAGERLTEVIRLQNGSRLPTVAFRVAEPLASLTGTDLVVDVAPIAPGATRTQLETLTGTRRGVYSFGQARLTLTDPLGLLSWTRHAGGELELLVFPRIASLRSCVFFGQRDPGEGRFLRTPLGHGSYEFRGVRPHQPGDPLNRIHWKSTAKLGSLMLREADDPAITGVALVLDGHKRSVAGTPPYDSFEAGVGAAGSIGDYLLREGFGVDLYLHESEPRAFHLTGTSTDRRQLLEALAAARPDAHTTVREYLERSQDRLVQGLALVVVSAAIDQGLALMLRRLRERGLPVYLVHLDGPSFAAARETLRSRTGDGGLADAEEHALLLNLQAAGVPSVTMRWGDDLAAALSLSGAVSWSPVGAGGAAS